MEALIAIAFLALLATNASEYNEAPQEIKSPSTSVEVVQPVKPKTQPKKQAAKKVASADPAKQQPVKELKKKEAAKSEPAKVVQSDPAKQQPAKDLAKKETLKSEPAKSEQTNVSSPAQKSNQSNLLYYILGILTLGAVSAYFYFRKGNQTADAKIYTSDELKQSLQQDSDKFKYQPPNPQETVREPQSQPSSSDPIQSQSPQATVVEPQQPSSSDQTSSDPKLNPEDEGKKS